MRKRIYADIKTRICVSVFLIFGFIGIISAHGEIFYEFNPDSFLTGALHVGAVESPTQLFQPQNDFLGGVDFWIDNEGTGGTVTFTLRDGNGNVLSSKSATVAQIPETPGGTRLHVDFDDQVAVSSGQIYSIEISTGMPDLRFYYASRILLLQHDALYASEYTGGVARIGGTEQNFTFKFALYETSETSPPVLSNVTSTIISLNEVRLYFNANEPVDFRADYGITGQGNNASTSFTGIYQFCGEGAGFCVLPLSVLPDNDYQYDLSARDFWGNLAVESGNFSGAETPPPPPSEENGTSTDGTLPPDDGDQGQSAPPPENGQADNGTEPGGNGESGEEPSQPPSTKFSIGDRIETTNNVNVRNSPSLSGTLLGTQLLGSRGNVVDGPVFGNNYWWWKINYDFGADGWSVEDFLVKIGSSANPLPPSDSPATPSQPNEPGVEIGNEINVSWEPPAGGEPTTGYYVDILDHQGNLIERIFVPAGIHQLTFQRPSDGSYRIIIYTDNGGVLEPLTRAKEINISAPPAVRIKIQIPPKVYWFGGALLLVILGIIPWRVGKYWMKE